MRNSSLRVSILDEEGHLKPLSSYVRELEEQIGRRLTHGELSKVEELHERTEALRFFR